MPESSSSDPRSKQRRARRTPKLRHHRASGQAFVEIDGRRIYLGVHGRAPTVERYHAFVAEWIANGYALPVPNRELTVVELVARFWKHAHRHYRHADGSPTTEPQNLRLALQPLLVLYGGSRAADFGPRALKAVRQRMVDAGGSRAYVNRHVNRIRHLFRWAVSEELVEPAVLEGLRSVPGLQFGRTEARETDPVLPVPDAHVRAIEPHVSRQVWALVQLQLLTAARPGELLPLRAIDIVTRGPVWTYEPARHKNAHRGHSRTIYFGPRAQAVLRPFLDERPLQAPLFSPKAAEDERRAKAFAERVTPLSCGNRPGTNRRRSPKREPGEVYTLSTYRRAIQRACERANVPAWSPHRLRHSAATKLREEFGLEGAQLLLGHRRADVTQLYAEVNRARALSIAEQVG